MRVFESLGHQEVSTLLLLELRLVLLESGETGSTVELRAATALLFAEVLTRARSEETWKRSVNN
jgi:hypothetical protein